MIDHEDPHELSALGQLKPIVNGKRKISASVLSTQYILTVSTVDTAISLTHELEILIEVATVATY